MSSSNSRQNFGIANEMFPAFFPEASSSSNSESDVERLKALRQECLQSLLLQQQQQQQQLLNKFVESPGLIQQQKSMQDALKCLKSLQLARSLENDIPR